MGLFSRIKSIFTKKETTSSQELAPATASVKVTDFTSGESVTTKTETTPSGTSTTTRTVNRAGGGGVSPQREEQLIAATEQLEASGRSAYVPPKEEITINRGETIQPGPKPTTVTAYEYTGQPPERYERPLGSAIGESFSNIFNLGIIGQQGLGAYAEQAFFTPFKNVGKPQAYDIAPNYNLQNWRGTEFGYGMSEEQKNIYRPPEFQTITYFEKGEREKVKLFSQVGLTYTGEPASLLPTRLGEKITGELKVKYEGQLAGETQGFFNFYQEKVNKGELTVDKAQAQFGARVQARADVLNLEFQKEAETTYQTKIAGFDKKIFEIQKYEAKIFEPPAYPIIRGIGKGVETTALIGATVFGGSGLALAASTYIGVKTASGAVQYAGAYKELTTGQRILGGASLAVGAAATAYTFNLGITKFYSEWRGIIYQDLASTPARIRGQEVLRTEELSRYDIAALRKQGSGTSLTVQRVDVYQTGADRVGFFGKGATITKIYDPEYMKFVTTTQKFTTSGYIPNIKARGLTFVNKMGSVTIEEGFYSGVGSAKYITGDKVRDYRFIAASKDSGEYYSVAGARNPQRSFTYDVAPGVKAYSTTVRGPFDSAGKMFKLPGEFGTSGLVITSGKKSSQAFFNKLYGLGSSAGYLTTKQISAFNLGTLAVKGVSAGAKTETAAVQGTRQAAQMIKFTPQEVQIQDARNYYLSYSLPSLNQILPTRQEQGQGLAYGGSGAFAILENVNVNERVLLSQGATQGLKLNQDLGLKLRNSFLVPNIPNLQGGFNVPNIPGTRFFFLPTFNLSPGGFELPSSVITGGKRRTGYTPSFSALVFNLRGLYAPGKTLRRSGIDFRPIIKGFKFRTGV